MVSHPGDDPLLTRFTPLRGLKTRLEPRLPTTCQLGESSTQVGSVDHVETRAVRRIAVRRIVDIRRRDGRKYWPSWPRTECIDQLLAKWPCLFQGIGLQKIVRFAFRPPKSGVPRKRHPKSDLSSSRVLLRFGGTLDRQTCKSVSLVLGIGPLKMVVVLLVSK